MRERLHRGLIMKKIALLGLVLVSSVGCGHGWLPFRSSRGAICRGDAPCATSAPADCNGCGTTAGYPGYEGSVIGGESVGDSGYYGGEVIHEGPVGGSFQGRSTITAPPMQSIQPVPGN